MKILLYILGYFTGLVCILGVFEGIGFWFFIITLSVSVCFFYFAHNYKKKSMYPNLGLESTNNEFINSMYDETDIYSKELDIPQVNKDSIQLPDKDNWETDFLTEENNSIPLNLLTLIEYIDAKNQYSKRRITIRRMVNWDNEFALLAYCHERQSHRTFKLSGIKSMCDIETGELISDPYSYLVQRFQDSPLGKWTKFLSEFENEVIILVFVAKADNRMTAKERKIIYNYACLRSKDTLDFEIIDSEIKKMYCDLKEFNLSLNKMKSLSEADKNNFISTIEAIIKTDKTVDPMELAALEKIKNKIL